MNKQQIRAHLLSYTDTERSALSQKSDPFNIETNEELSYNKTLDHAISKNEKMRDFLNDSQLLIVKHARFSTSPPHSHDYIEMCYVYSGKIDMVINSEKISLNQGDFCLLDTGVIHQILDTAETDILINILIKREYFSTKMVSKIAHNSTLSKFAIDALSEDQKHNQFIVFETVNHEFIEDAIFGILTHYLEPSIFSKEVIDTYMIIIFSELLRSFHEKKVQYYQSHNQLYIGDILTYIEQRQGNCTLSDLARVFNFNSNYLSRFIKKNAGKSFIDLIQEIRLNHATTLLRTTDLSIEAIIQQSGYKNINFFYKKFYAAFHESPKDYRKRLQQLGDSL